MDFTRTVLITISRMVHICNALFVEMKHLSQEKHFRVANALRESRGREKRDTVAECVVGEKACNDAEFKGARFCDEIGHAIKKKKRTLDEPPVLQPVPVLLYKFFLDTYIEMYKKGLELTPDEFDMHIEKASLLAKKEMYVYNKILGFTTFNAISNVKGNEKEKVDNLLTMHDNIDNFDDFVTAVNNKIEEQKREPRKRKRTRC